MANAHLPVRRFYHLPIELSTLSISYSNQMLFAVVFDSWYVKRYRLQQNCLSVTVNCSVIVQLKYIISNIRNSYHTKRMLRYHKAVLHTYILVLCLGDVSHTYIIFTNDRCVEPTD